MLTVTDWHTNLAVHERFAKFCKCDKNAKLELVTELIRREPHVGFARYSDALATCKILGQWKARALAAKLPSESVLAARTPPEVLRLLAVRFTFDASLGDVISADLRDRDYFLDQEALDWLAQ